MTDLNYFCFFKGLVLGQNKLLHRHFNCRFYSSFGSSFDDIYYLQSK